MSETNREYIDRFKIHIEIDGNVIFSINTQDMTLKSNKDFKTAISGIEVKDESKIDAVVDILKDFNQSAFLALQLIDHKRRSMEGKVNGLNISNSISSVVLSESETEDLQLEFSYKGKTFVTWSSQKEIVNLILQDQVHKTKKNTVVSSGVNLWDEMGFANDPLFHQSKTSILEKGNHITITLSSKDHGGGFVSFGLSKSILIDMLSKATSGATVVWEDGCQPLFKI